jgi:phytoene/squalene synthetase
MTCPKAVKSYDAKVQNPEFYQLHLNKVSRSFAFCIARLREPLRTWVALSYLLCRVLDTSEDAIWVVESEKTKSLHDFKKFLFALPLESEVFAWQQKVPATLERNLLNDFYLLLIDFHSLPDKTRKLLQRSITSMNEGMIYFSDKNKKNELKLHNLAEVNSYCFFVAGLVGELLTDLIKEIIPDVALPQDIYLKSHHFGLFLQKINLLKDQKEDEQQGRFLVPDRKELLNSLFKNARGAVDYIVHIPSAQKEFRLFCAWSLFLGLSSLKWIESSFLTGLSNKIPRWMTEKLLVQVETIIENDKALQTLFNEMLHAQSQQTYLAKSATSASAQAWPLAPLYKGPLNISDFADLGLI